jgi:hypothetical protein
VLVLHVQPQQVPVQPRGAERQLRPNDQRRCHVDGARDAGCAVLHHGAGVVRLVVQEGVELEAAQIPRMQPEGPQESGASLKDRAWRGRGGFMSTHADRAERRPGTELEAGHISGVLPEGPRQSAAILEGLSLEKGRSSFVRKSQILVALQVTYGVEAAHIYDVQLDGPEERTQLREECLEEKKRL